MIDWEDLIYQTAERFGGTTPHPDTAAAIAAVYAKSPSAVIRAIDRVAQEHEDGNIRSPWGILRSRVQQITVTTKSNARANDTEKAVARAEQWMRTTGLHYDRATELLDELYGDRGRLRDHPQTRDRMLELWRELRPEGERLDAEAVEAGIRYQQHRATLKDTATPAETAEQRLERQRKLAARKAFGNVDISEALR